MVETLIVSVKSERRGDAPEDWVDQLRSVPGVEVVKATPRFARVRVPSDVAAQLTERFSYCHFEEPVVLRPL